MRETTDITHFEAKIGQNKAIKASAIVSHPSEPIAHVQRHCVQSLLKGLLTERWRW